MMIILPFVLIPGLFGVVYTIQSQQAEKATEQQMKVSFFGQEYAPELYQAFADLDKVIILDQIPADSVDSYIQNEYLDAAIYVNREYQESIDQNKQAPIIIKFKGTDSFGITRDRIKSLLTAQENQIITKRMNQLNLKPDIVKAYQIEYKDIASTQEKLGKFVGGFLPYFFIIFGFMGAMYPALDLGAGEKERGTLETILSSPATRLDVVLGKFLVVMLAAITTAFIALGGMYLGIQTFPDIEPWVLEVVNVILSAKTVILMMSLIIPISAFFSALLLGLSIYAKSFKEAQSIVGPLNIAIIFPAMIGMIPGIELNAITSLIPILNVSLASKDIIAGTINPWYMVEVYLSLIVFAGLAIVWCVNWFNRESTIFRN
jgi:sodium transport system permease protein